jgi:hypothetical protein
MMSKAEDIPTFCPILKDNCRRDCVFWGGPNFQIGELQGIHYRDHCIFLIIPFAIGDLLDELTMTRDSIETIGKRIFPDLRNKFGDD